MISFKQLISNKSISYVPIYSMFSHETGKINLTCDGNVNRWMTAFSKNLDGEHQVKIFGPTNCICDNWDQFKKNFKLVGENLKYIPTELIKKSAGFQRSDIFGNKFLKQFSSELLFPECRFDDHIIIAEGQGLIRSLLATKEAFNSYRQTQISTFDKIREFPEIAFWCPVCQTNKKTRSFFGKDDKEENEKLFKEVDYVIVVAKDQIEYLKECGVKKSKIVYSPELIDRSLEMFNRYKVNEVEVNRVKELGDKVIYLPFRLSDEGYKIWDIIETLNKFDNIKIVCPNVNGSSDDELVKLCLSRSQLKEIEVRKFLKRVQPISSDRDVYYSIIDNCNNVIIPYFEDIDFVMHAAVDELLRGKKKPICKVVQNKEDLTKELEK